MNQHKIIFNACWTIILIILWAGILFATFLLWVVSDIFRLLGNGMLIYLVYSLAFILPIVFRKRIKRHFSLPLGLILSAISAVFIVMCIFFGVNSYMSTYSKEKWAKYENMRIHMIDDLEDRYQIVGKTEKEVVDLLGEPTHIYDTGHVRYEYYVGENLIDPYVYRIVFDNHIVLSTSLMEH